MSDTGEAVIWFRLTRRGLGRAATVMLAVGLLTPMSVAAMRPVGGWGGAQPAAQPASGSVQVAVQTTARRSSAWTGSYSVYRAHAFSVQRNDYSCVAAAAQMMLNTIKGTRNHARKQQIKIWHYAQDNSYYPVSDNGADVGGWVAALEHWGAGDYYVDVASSMDAALRHAATQLRLTGKPVGLIVWGRHSGHAWVMTGVQATADPAAGGSFDVTAVQAMGPLWPYGTINGHAYDPGPGTWVGMAELTRKFTTYHAPKSPAWVGRWLTVLPG